MRRFFSSVTDDALFDRVVHARRSALRFDATRAVERGVLRGVLEATLRSPSSFNLLAYRVVLAEDARFRERISACMSGGANSERVRAAPLAAVFFADLDALSDVDALAAREFAAGSRSSAYLRGLRANAALFASSRAATVGTFAAGARALTGVGSGCDGLAWATKGTSLALMSFMLAATSRGLATYAMEGFDARTLGSVVNLERGRFAPICVVAVGYEADAAAAARAPRSTRPPLGDIFKVGSAHAPFEE